MSDPLFTGERRESIKEIYLHLIIRLKLDNYWEKKLVYFCKWEMFCWNPVRLLKLLRKGSTEDPGFISQLTCILIQQPYNIVIQSCWLSCYISQFQNAKYKKQWQTTMPVLCKTKVRTPDVTPMTCPFLWATNICIGLIYKKWNKRMSQRDLKKVTYTKSNITSTVKK